MNPNIRKIEALLTTANHPNTPQHEADAASAAAERLMLKYAIDQSMLTGSSGQSDAIIKKVMKLTGQYKPIQRSLLSSIAEPFNVKTVVSGGSKNTVIALIGTESAIASVEKLFASLSIQMANAAAKARPQYAEHGAAVVSWRTNFQKGFVYTVYTRLTEQVENAKAEAVAEHGPGVGLVLMDEAARVKAALAEMYPKLRQMQQAKAKSFGWSDGKKAGNSVDIGNRQISTRLAIGAGR